MQVTGQNGWGRPLLLTAIVMVVVALIVGFWLGRAQDDRIRSIISASLPKSEALPNVIWRKHDRLAYALSLDGLISPVSSEPMVYHLDSRLCVHVLEIAPSNTLVSMQLRNISRTYRDEIDPKTQAAMSLPFLVTFTGGLPSKIHFPEELDVKVQFEISEIIRTFQVSLPETSVNTWQTLESHEDGQYQAAYQVDSDGVFTKKKLRYQSLGPSAQDLNVDALHVINSLATLTPAKNASWWKEAQVNDEVEFLVGNAPFIRIKKHSVLTTLREECQPNAEFDNISNTQSILDIVISDEFKNIKPAAVQTRAPSAGDRARFRKIALAFMGSDEPNLSNMQLLADMLIEFPALSSQIPLLLSQDSISETVSAGLIHALELAGNEASQRVLSDMTSEASGQHANRLRSIIGLSGVENPSAHSIETLMQIAESGGDPKSEDLANTALLALGNISKTLREAGDESYGDLSTRLGSDLTGQTRETKSVILAAIANAEDPSLLPYAEAELEDSESMVRIAAAQALASVDSPESLSILFRGLQGENNSQVKASIVDGLSQLSYKDDAVFDSILTMIATEQDKQVRGTMALYLADNLDIYSTSRQMLQTFVYDERNKAVFRADVASKLRASQAKDSIER